MQTCDPARGPTWLAPVFLLSILVAAPALAQDQKGDASTQLEAVEVTGTRIKSNQAQGASPVLSISREELQAAGVGSVGDILQRLTVSSSALNTKFNSAGNFGFPSDSGGVGSGSTTLSLRNLGCKRVLVLVDGLRWVNESSASGVSGCVDLNTIPLSAVERIEILTDGASSLYGSDAIAGVVNIITRKKADGAGGRIYFGDYSVGDGRTMAGNVTLGGSSDKADFILDVNYFKQRSISSAETEQSSFPVPGTGVRFGSSATPTTRSVFVDPNGDTHGGLCPNDPDSGGAAVCDITANGTAGPPGFTPSFPAGGPGDFHPFIGRSPTGDRFNFAPFNLLLTPSDRKGLFSQVRYHFLDHLDGWIKGAYQSRRSVNQAAPEPIFIGPGAGTGGLADTISVDVTNPFNPFGYTLDAGPGGNFIFAGRRPLEGGPRVFTQNVETRYLAGGIAGDFTALRHQFYWDLNVVDSRNRATQTVQGTYNIAHIARALGPVANCTAPCVPLNFFGGPGTITQAMLDYIGFTENDHSVQGLDIFSANVSGGLVDLWAGSLDVASGVEHRRYSGEYAPDAVVTAGETNGVPSLPTSGAYDVDEWYMELNIPVIGDVPFADKLDVTLATRYSDYSTFGGTWNSKFGFRWRPVKDVTTRLTWAEGFRAPTVGELFGSPARFDATIEDPCDHPTDPTIAANCAAMGVPAGFSQANTQISVRTGGNAALEPETSKSLTSSIIYSPSWAENSGWASRLDLELTYYHHMLDDAIQPIDPQTQLDRCAATGSAAFCGGITRGPTGDINGFDNTLRNLGTVKTEGFDFTADWVGPQLAFGQPGINWATTWVTHYEAVSRATGLREPAAVGVEVTDSAIPRVRSNLRLKHSVVGVEASWALRYISRLREDCGGAIAFPVCSDPSTGTNELDSVIYNDVRLQYTLPGATGAKVAAGVNNVFNQGPPVCVSCSLNGYDASTYDLPGRFGYVEASIGF